MILKYKNETINVTFYGVDRESLEVKTKELDQPTKLDKSQLNDMAIAMGVAIIGTDRFNEVVESQLKYLNDLKKTERDEETITEINKHLKINLDMLKRSKEIEPW